MKIEAHQSNGDDTPGKKMSQLQRMKNVFKTNNWKAYSTFVGATLLHIVVGANMLGNIITYLTSYMHKNVSKDITYAENTWLTTSTVIGFTVSTIVSGFAARVVPLKIILFVGVLLSSSANFLCSFAIDSSFVAVVLTIGVIQSVGSGCVYTHAIVTSTKWFPRNRGFVTGAIIALDCVTTFVVMLLQTEYINPDDVLADDDGYILDPKVLERLPVYLRSVTFLYVLIGSLGVVTIFQPEELHNILVTPDDDPEQKIGSRRRRLSVRMMQMQYDVLPALKTRTSLVLFTTFGLSTVSWFFMSMMAKPFAQFIKDDKFLTLIVSMANLANFLGSFFCGKVVDKFRFKRTMLALNVSVAALYFTLILCEYWQSRTLYFIWTFLINFVSNGFFSSYLPEVMNKFGDRHSSAIYGFIHCGPVVGEMVFSPLLTKLINSFQTNHALLPGQIQYGYFYSFITIGCLNLLTTVILIFYY